MMNAGDSDTEGYDSNDEYWSTARVQRIFKAVPSVQPNCYSFRTRVGKTIYKTIWGALDEENVDLGAIEEAQIKLIKKAIKKNIKEELRPEAEEKAFACLEKEIGRAPVHRRRSQIIGGKSTRKKRRKTRRKMPEPKDKKLYQRAKKYIYKKHTKHSAYRSGLLVQKYKKDFKKKYGNKNPYIGKKTKKKGLKRWFAEKWVNQRGKVGYKYKNDIYRPSKRITKGTPLTHKELSKKEIKRARTRKYKHGRVKKFRTKKKRK